MLKSDILKKLKEKNDYVSGQDLCEEFGVSRTAVWKAVNNLKKEGFLIDSVTNKGYLLRESEDVFSKASLESAIETKWLGKKLCFFDEIDSTNTELKRMAETGEVENGTLAITENQTKGRGRRGREWKTIVGTNIAMSFILKPEFAPDRASMLTILAAMAIAEGTKNAAGVQCQIKWPNDVLINKKKYCGILTEMSAEPDFIHYVIVGIGINANTTEFPKEVEDIATSICRECGEKISRAKLVNEVLKAFERIYKDFEKSCDLSNILISYNKMLVSMGKKVRVLDPKGEFEGISRGINKEGELLVETSEGIVNVYAGEVSVRGIYGYGE